GGGLPARSFTQAFVATKAQEIEQQLRVALVSTAPAGIFRNLTGVVEGATGGSTVPFTAEFTGDGTGQGFDLLFVRPGTGIVLGSIPVTINTDYFSLVRAMDPDGDPLTYSLLEAPAGATIHVQTGQLAWTPPAPGTYHFRVQVADGRGGLDVQDYDVTVTAGQP